ncbi:MAG: DsbA family protein [Gammaproteobacteria bacterium]
MNELILKRTRLAVGCVLLSLAAAAIAGPGKKAETYQKTPVGFTEQGYPYRGDPKAPVVIEEYSDYLCPYCGRHAGQTLPALVEKYITTGKVKYVFHDFPIAALHPTAAEGHAAARCAGEQSAASFWKLHDALFSQQKAWKEAKDQGKFITQTAKDAGVDMKAYQACMASGRGKSAVEKSVAEGKALGFTGTPTFQFSRKDGDKTYTLSGAQSIAVFSDWTDKLLAGKEPPVPKPPELPLWSKPEGLAPDPARPGFTVAGDAFKGNPKAALAVIEFTDFECPSCRKHALETQPELDKRYVETDKVLWVSKHFPLKSHPHSAVAAAAAECAGEQNKYWEMHHALFAEQEKWSKDDKPADDRFLAMAEQLGLKMPEFKACFNGRPAMERVLEDVFDAQHVIDQTPTFLLVHAGQGNRIKGALPPEKFAEFIDKFLDQKNAAAKDKAAVKK